MRFDLTDLQLLLNVAEAGTITGGAESTFMTLASASERIKGMEDALGARLLTRSRKGAKPTAAGEAVLHHARIVVRQMERLQGELRDLGAGVRGYVRVFCNTSALVEHLPRELGRFLRAHPGISIDLEERPSPAVADAVRDGTCDLGVLADTAEMSGLESYHFRPDPLVLVTPLRHRLADRTGASLADVVDEPFVGLAEGAALQALVAAQARRLGRRLHYRVRLAGLESVCRMVAEGTGVGIVPLAVAARRSGEGSIAVLKLLDGWAERSLCVCVRRRGELPSHAALLLKHLLEPPAHGSLQAAPGPVGGLNRACIS